MATYVYETIPADPAQPRRRFEVQQSMKDAPLTRDPQTGDPVRRVISGGYGFVGTSKGDSAPMKAPSGGGCGHGGCGCGHAH
jgi:predicted nucleic acid-binding Zn ribbon protein